MLRLLPLLICSLASTELLVLAQTKWALTGGPWKHYEDFKTNFLAFLSVKEQTKPMQHQQGYITIFPVTSLKRIY